MANYPTSASTDANLYIAKNNLSTTLNGAINNSVTTITVASTTGFPTTGYITIDAEAISYTGTTGTTFTGCTRGADGTTAASHADLANVYHNVVAAHHNLLKDEIIAAETDLVNVQSSITPVTATDTATSLLNRLAMFAQRFKDLTGLTNWYDTFTSFPINKGGTNSTTTLNNNRIMKSSGGAIVEAASISAAKMLISDSNGIPIAANTNADMGSNKITGLANGTASTDAAAFGQIKVIQTVMSTSTSSFSTTSSSFQGTNLSVSITPTSSSNKILIWATGTLSTDGTANGFYTIRRSTTNLLDAAGAGRTGSVAAGLSQISMVYLDSPATTSSTTYSTAIRNDDNTTSKTWSTSGTQVIIAMEVV